MDPMVDEIVILTLLRIVPDFMDTNLHISARQEAYGPSKNEGLCYESCSAVNFSGDLNGMLYYCMDGYTKLKMLPRIASRFQIDPGARGMAESIVLEFSSQMSSQLISELKDGGFEIHLESPENMSHKIIPIDLDLYRQYIIIFFLRERREKIYLGRAYFVLTLKKF